MTGVWTLLLACGPGGAPAVPADPEPLATGDTATPEPTCPQFGEAAAVGVVQEPTLTEASGLVRAGGWLWTHNDSGEPTLFALGDQGQVAGRVPVRTTWFDVEDIAVRDDRMWLADIGDNLAIREEIRFFDLPIPAPTDAEAVPRQVTARWPDGPTDAEALLVDPRSGDVLVVSKQWSAGPTRVARLVTPDAADSAMEIVAEVWFGEGGIGRSPAITGGDVAPDGSGVVLRTYLAAWWFPRRPGEPWADTFARPPCEVPVRPEGQGEALAVDAGFVWTLSEGVDRPLNQTAYTHGPPPP